MKEDCELEVSIRALGTLQLTFAALASKNKHRAAQSHLLQRRWVLLGLLSLVTSKPDSGRRAKM